MGKEQVLLFGLTDAKMKQSVKQALLPLRVRIRVVAPSEYGKQIGALAGLPGFEEDSAKQAGSASDTEKEAAEKNQNTANANAAGSSTPENAAQNSRQELSDPMLVLAFLAPGRLDEVLLALRRQHVVLPYKAVLTESNASWTAPALLDELKKEHEAMHCGTN
jgi:hypothetical protein